MSKRSILVRSFCVLGVLTVTLASAGIPPTEPFGLWGFGESVSSRSLALDLEPTVTGIETLNFNERFFYRPYNPPPAEEAGDVLPMVRRFHKLRIDSWDALGSQLVQTYEATYLSAPFPDPADPTYGQGGTLGTFYSVNPLEDTFPSDFLVGLGVAHGTGSQRVFVLGLAFVGFWTNPFVVQQGELARYWVVAWDADTGALLWQKWFPEVDGDWELLSDFCGVGDFNADGPAEVRIVQERDLPTGVNQQRWRYLDLLTGAQTSSKIVSVPRP